MLNKLLAVLPFKLCLIFFCGRAIAHVNCGNVLPALVAEIPTKATFLTPAEFSVYSTNERC